MATEVVLHGTIRLVVKFALRMFTFMTNFGEDFAVLVSSRAVRISGRAVHVFPALSLRRVRPSYGTFSLMVFQENCAGAVRVI